MHAERAAAHIPHHKACAERTRLRNYLSAHMHVYLHSCYSSPRLVTLLHDDIIFQDLPFQASVRPAMVREVLVLLVARFFFAFVMPRLRACPGSGVYAQPRRGLLYRKEVCGGTIARRLGGSGARRKLPCRPDSVCCGWASPSYKRHVVCSTTSCEHTPVGGAQFVRMPCRRSGYAWVFMVMLEAIRSHTTSRMRAHPGVVVLRHALRIFTEAASPSLCRAACECFPSGGSYSAKDGAIVQRGSNLSSSGGAAQSTLHEALYAARAGGPEDT